MKPKLLIIFSLFIGVLFAQNKIQKPLYHLYLDSAASKNLNYKTTQALTLAQKAENLGIPKSDSAALLKLNMIKAESYFDMKKLYIADSFLTYMNPISIQLKDTISHLKILTLKGNIASLKGHYAEALLKYTQAQVYTYKKYPDRHFGISTNMARAYSKIGQYDKALSNMSESLNYYINIKDSVNIALAYNNIGEIYREHLHEYEMALNHLYKSKKINIKINNEYQLAKNYNNIGLVFLSRQVYDSAEHYLNKSIDLKKSIQDEGGSIIGLVNLGDVYQETHEYDNALDVYTKSLQLSKKLGITLGEFYSYLGFGNVYVSKKDNEKALPYIKKAQAIAEQFDSFDEQKLVYGVLYEFYKNEEKYDQAILWLEKIGILKDSIHEKLHQQNFGEVRTLYEKQLSENELKLVKAEQSETQLELKAKKQEVYTYLSISIILILIISGLIVTSIQRKKSRAHERETHQKISKQNTALKKQEKELNELNEMKNKLLTVLGHDLRSPLSSILGFFEILQLEGLSEKERGIIIKQLQNETEITLKTLENILSWAQIIMHQKIITRKTQISLDILFEEIEKLYEGPAQLKNIELHFKITPNLHLMADSHQLRSMISNLLGNAIKFTPSQKSVLIEVQKIDTDKVEISISDQGKGISKEVMDAINTDAKISEEGTIGEKGTGIGLTLVKEFSLRNNGNFSFSSIKPTGTKATLIFPLLIPSGDIETAENAQIFNG